jgi:hypothetical protein
MSRLRHSIWSGDAAPLGLLLVHLEPRGLECQAVISVHSSDLLAKIENMTLASVGPVLASCLSAISNR